MASRVPASPSLSPGRRLFRAVPHSPSLGFRAPPVAASTTVAAKHSKSTSDLNQAGRSRYDPSRISGGTPCNRPSRGPSPPPSVSPRRSTFRTTTNGQDSSSASRANTPYSPGSSVWGPSGMRSSVPSRSSAPPPRQKHNGGPFFASGCSRGSSAERRSPQWTNPIGSFSKGSAVVTLESSSYPLGSQFASVGTQSWGGSPRSTMTSHLTGSGNRSWSQSSQGRRADALNPRMASSASRTASFAETQKDGLVAGKSATTPNNGLYEAQMANLKNSLLQHIHSVQKEITRLQMERQRQNNNERQQSGISSHANGVTQLPAVAVALSSPVVSSRGVSVERERMGRELGSSTIQNRPSHSSNTIRVDPIIQAVLRIQRFWRKAKTCSRHAARRSRRKKSARSNGKKFVAYHHAACRIQRAWRVSNWRRRFTNFSEKEIGWLGTLDWLQHQNLLYGTELADPEDVRWWMLQRKGAPLDREVDPWGCTKLRDHLNKVWYGRSTEELEEVQALQAEYMETQYLEAVGYDHRYEQRLDESYLQNWGAEAALAQGRASGVDVYNRSYSQMATSTLRSPSSGERQLDTRNAQVATVIGSAISSSVGSSAMVTSSPVRTASSLSPRRAAIQLSGGMDSEMTSRSSNGHIVGNMGNVGMQRAVYQSSPPQTHRAPRTSGGIAVSTSMATSLPVGSLTAAMPDGVVPAMISGMNPSMRPRSPITAQRVQASVSQPGLLSVSANAAQHAAASVQVSRHLAGGPPPSSLIAQVARSSYAGAATCR